MASYEEMAKSNCEELENILGDHGWQYENGGIKRLNLFSFAAARANHLRDGWQIVRESGNDKRCKWCILANGAEKIALVWVLHRSHYSRTFGIYC